MLSKSKIVLYFSRAFISQYGLEGVTPSWAKKKWENLKQKYKDLKCPRTGVSTEDGEHTAASWKWYSLMDEAIGGRPSVTPPVLIASSSQDAAVCSCPSVVTPERSEERITPKRRRVVENISVSTTGPQPWSHSSPRAVIKQLNDRLDRQKSGRRSLMPSKYTARMGTVLFSWQ
ncbi:hypothetical protein DPX16_14844 [Anabarilius grahami]|uniref:MADF domain-containing protein n=1 Tax=Anabarilius grahami TaxID=495550 RepID=A0A3N0YW12_ANAGA|nr:hypothetical protein DPX16_14844 [Anabarilius grahami]